MSKNEYCKVCCVRKNNFPTISKFKMNYFEIVHFIRQENCELISHGRWTYTEICQDLVRIFNVPLAEQSAEWYGMVFRAYSELVKQQEYEDRCRYFGWAMQARAA